MLSLAKPLLAEGWIVTDDLVVDLNLIHNRLPRIMIPSTYRERCVVTIS